MTDKRHQRFIDYLNSRGKSPVRLWGWGTAIIISAIFLVAVFGRNVFDYFESLSPITQAVSVIIICGVPGIFFIVKFVKR